MVLKRPIRSLRGALRYLFPKRLTISPPHVYAWLWWNYMRLDKEARDAD